MAKLQLQPVLGLSWLLAALVAPRAAHADPPAPAPSQSFVAQGAPLPQLASIPQLAPPTPHLVAVPLPLPPPPPPPRRLSRPPVIWYGWEPLAAGAGTYLLSLAVLKNDPQTALLLGAMLSPLTTMSMHVLHGDEVKGYLSLPLSYAIIAGGGVLAEKLECGRGSSDSCGANAVFTGMILGGLGALVVDAALLAWGAPLSPPPVKKAVLWPSMTPVRGGGTLGLGGTF